MPQILNCLRNPCLLFLVLLIWNGCKKEDKPLELTGNNRWILDSMKVYYYWKDQLPNRPQDRGTATTFFKSLLHPADRFSFLFDPAEQRKEYSSFAWYGFEYVLLENKTQTGELTGMVTLVVPDGPADRKGLKRGDIFIAVNDLAVTKANTEAIARILRLGDGIRLSVANLTPNGLTASQVYHISFSRYTEQPVYVSKVFSTGGKKAGYIFYNEFAGSYDQQILDALGSLRNEGIDELILDLRYNPGGDVSTAAKVTAALSTVTAEQTFVVYQANSNGGRRISSFQRTINENSYPPQSFHELLNYRIALNRVIVLTSASTASAAELLINNLRPYITVIQVGGTTMGKDMASFAIADLNSPKQVNIVLHPLVFKLYNAKNEGNYQTGLKPDYAVDEFSVVPLRPFGDPEDPLLKKALEIAGIQTTRNFTLKNTTSAGTIKYHSAIIRSRESVNIEISKTLLQQK